MTSAPVPLWRRLLAEFLGSAFLAAVVIGSGIAAQRLSPGQTGLELLENAAATAAGLFAIILMFGPVSGGHFNPVVSFADAAFGGLSWRDAAAYLPAQVAGCIAGAVLANLMFALPAVTISAKHRAIGRAFPVRGHRHRRAAAGDLRAGPVRAGPVGPGGGGRLHRRGVLVHLLDQLRQPGHHHRPDVLRHLRRDRPVLGPQLHRRADHRRRRWPSAVIKALYPAITPAEAAGIIVPHDGSRRPGQRMTACRRPRTGAGPVQLTRHQRETAMHVVMIGGSDAGISAALRARELDPAADVTVVLEDAYPNFSICGIPYYVSGEVTHWRNLAHRTIADLEAAGMRLRPDTTARRIDVPGRKLLVTTAGGGEEVLGYDKLVIGTGAVPVRPPIAGLAGPGALGPADGVHLLHSMGDTFAVMRTLEEAAPASAVIVGAGYIGLEMADALTVRGLQVTQMEQLPEVLPTVDPELGALVHAELAAHGVEVLTGTTVQAISTAPPGGAGRLQVAGHHSRRHGRDPPGRHGPGRRRGAARDRPGRRRRGRARRQGRDRGRPGCGPACRTSTPPGTA